MLNGLVVDENGYKFWWVNGKLHREDGPAIEYNSGIKQWYINDQLHREDGPAIEQIDGYKYWFLEGKEYTEEEWKKQLLIRKLAGIK